MAKKSDPLICEHVLKMLKEKKSIAGWSWEEVRSNLDLDEGVALHRVKTAIGSLSFKRRLISVHRPMRYDGPSSDRERGFRLVMVA